MITFVQPTADELSRLRADPLVFEQELDVRPDVARSLERELRFRAGRKYWRSSRGLLYAIELGDFGRGLPSMAVVYGFWDRFEPRPPEHLIDEDLQEFCVWIAEVCDGLDPSDIEATFASIPTIRERAR